MMTNKVVLLQLEEDIDSFNYEENDKDYYKEHNLRKIRKNKIEKKNFLEKLLCFIFRCDD